MKHLLWLALLLPFFANAQTNGTIQKTSATGTVRGSFGSLGLDTLPRVTGALVDGYILKYHAATNKWYASPDGVDSLGFYVKKTGDTMTGTLNGTDINLSGDLLADSLKGNGTLVTGVVHTTGDQTVNGIKTFQSTADIQQYVYVDAPNTGNNTEAKFGAKTLNDLTDFGTTGQNFTKSGIWKPRMGIVHTNAARGLGIGTNTGPIDFSAAGNVNTVTMRMANNRVGIADTLNTQYTLSLGFGGAAAEYQDISLGGQGWGNGERHAISGTYSTTNTTDKIGSMGIGYDTTNRGYAWIGNLFTTTNQTVDKFRFFSSGNAAIGFDNATDDFTHVLRVNGLAKATGFTTGGASTSFLKADGSVDINAYIPTNGFNGVTGNINSITANGFTVTGQTGLNAYYRVNQATNNSGGNWRFGNTGAIAGFNYFGFLEEVSGITPLSMTSAGGTLVGDWVAPTQTAGDNSTKIATTAYVDRLGGGTITSGTYTPTLTNGVNVSSSSAGTGIYQRIGNVVSGYVDFIATGSASLLGEVGVSLPIASDFTLSTDVFGSLGIPRDTESTTSPSIPALNADTTNNRFRVVPSLVSGTPLTYRFNFTYLIK